MLTLAALSASAQKRGADFSHGTERVPDSGFAHAQGGLPGAAHATYWPCELLNAFTLKMATLGHCVNTDMMLGHRPYAQQQLAVARASHDQALSALALRLQSYFDTAAPDGCKVAAALDEAQRGRLLMV